MEMPDLPKFSPLAKVFLRGSKDHEIHAYQYATTSQQEGSMSPAAIIIPRDVNDIQLAIKYARENGVGIAVRTGGHQYTGASSTSANNIQLNLSDTFESVIRDFCYDHETELLRVGVSFSLLQVNSMLRNMKMFIPHGYCAGVHMGGHAQTGGYGQLTHAFGLMCDHIEGFEILLANGEHKKIWRPNSTTRKLIVFPEDIAKENDDLFWAVMGGSPGNYGILTHLQIRPLHDDRYSGSRGMKVFTHYTKEKMNRLLQVMTEMSDDPDLPRNFDYCVNLQTDVENSFYFKRAFRGSQELTRDEEMLLYYPEQYADGVDWAEEGKLAAPVVPVPIIAVYFQWANIDGGKECFGLEERKWFEKIRCASEPMAVDAPKIQANGSHKMEEMILFLKAILPESHPNFDPEAKAYYLSHVETMNYADPIPMSQLTRYWLFEDEREFALPFEKRVYLTDKTDLSTNGWVEWASERVDVIAGGYQSNDSLNLSIQFLLFGGKNSELHRIGAENPQDSSHSWRTDTTICEVLDGFYDPRDPNALPTLLKWQDENDKGSMEGGIFCDKDRRYLWGTFHRPYDKDGGASLDSVWDKYFDSKEKYHKLIDIKRKVDPEYVFTPNLFGVDASNAPESKKTFILGIRD